MGSSSYSVGRLQPRPRASATNGRRKRNIKGTVDEQKIRVYLNHRSDHHGALRRRQSPFQIETTARLLRDLVIPQTHGQLSGESAWQHLGTTGHAWSHLVTPALRSTLLLR